MNSTLAPAAKRTTSRSQREELYALVEAGYFGAARVELVGGELLTAWPEPPTHDAAVGRLHERLLGAESDRVTVYLRNYLELPSGDVVQPDVCAVVEEDGAARPLLVVEVATGTLRRDRTTKSELYAAAGVEEYWIVNPRAGQVEVRRDPSGPEYVSQTLVGGEEALRPLFAPDLEIGLSALLAL